MILSSNESTKRSTISWKHISLVFSNVHIFNWSRNACTCFWFHDTFFHFHSFFRKFFRFCIQNFYECNNESCCNDCFALICCINWKISRLFLIFSSSSIVSSWLISFFSASERRINLMWWYSNFRKKKERTSCFHFVRFAHFKLLI